MKTKTKKITQYSMLALAASAVVPMSCGTKEEADDPNITFRTVNLSITTSTVNTNQELAIDIDANGTNDIGIATWYSDYADLRRGCWIETSGGYPGAGEVLTSIISGLKVTNFLANGTDINSASATWDSNYGYVSQSKNAVAIGTADNVDKYIGVRFKISGAFHYGWLKVRVTNSGKTLTLKEAAFDIRSDTAIKAGAK